MKKILFLFLLITFSSNAQTFEFFSVSHGEKYENDSLVTVIEPCNWMFQLNNNILKYSSKNEKFIEKINGYSFDDTILIWTYESTYEIVYKNDIPYLIYEVPIYGDILYKVYWLDGEF
jgi:hypothetical protein